MNVYVISVPFYVTRDRPERGRTPNRYVDIEIHAESEEEAVASFVKTINHLFPRPPALDAASVERPLE